MESVRNRADKTDPQCPLMISSRAWRHCCRYCYGFTLASLPWLVDLTEVTGQANSMAWGKFALLLLRKSELSIRRPDRDWQTDRQRQKGRSNNTCKNTCTQLLVDHNDAQWPTSRRRLGIKTSSLYSHSWVINSVHAAEQ